MIINSGISQPKERKFARGLFLAMRKGKRELS